MEAPLGIDVAKVSAWLIANIDGTVGPFEFDLIAAGHSNLTFKVTDGRASGLVLRRPPLGHLLASAHDMGREFRIISAIGTGGVPVAPPLGFCDDESVNGAPFYVMGLVEGLSIRTLDDARDLLTVDARRRCGESLVDVLAALHRLDPDEVGLGTLGKRDDYVARQLKRWSSQLEQSKTRDLQTLVDTHARLVTRIPAQPTSGIVHGDYRLDNCIVASSGEVRGVLDWELCTLGETLVDVAMLYVYWDVEADGPASLPTAPTTAEGFFSADEMVERYAAASGRDLSDFDYFVAFGYWRIACIVEGVYSRYLNGQRGERDPADLVGFALQVDWLAERAARVAARLR